MSPELHVILSEDDTGQHFRWCANVNRSDFLVCNRIKNCHDEIFTFWDHVVILW